jgi:hypothetical protein
MNFSKNTSRKLGQLADEAYNRHLGRHLEELYKHFQSWKDGKISASELNQRVHEYHQGPARDLWGSYNYFKPPYLVAQALTLGLLEEDEIPAEALEEMRSKARSLKQIWDDER